MWYTACVVRMRVNPTAFSATSHPPASTKNSRKSNHCHTSTISSRNSFACHTYKNKGLKVLCLPHIFQVYIPTPVTVNRVPA
jgi:hypothetical protein